MRASDLLPAAAAVLLAGCTGDSRVTPTTPVLPSIGTIAIVSGNNQSAKAGEPLAHPFVVRVIDTVGMGVKGATVDFSVTSGAGTVAEAEDYVPGASVTTNADGLAQVTFLPKVLGRSEVRAAVVRSQAAPVTFAVDARVLVIERWGPLYDIGFIASPCFCGDVTVPVGTPLEWKINRQSSTPETTFTVVSTVTPRGGAPFDSGLLRPSDRFRFVPSVAGTWQYQDRMTGHTGTVTVR